MASTQATITIRHLQQADDDAVRCVFKQSLALHFTRNNIWMLARDAMRFCPRFMLVAAPSLLWIASYAIVHFLFKLVGSHNAVVGSFPVRLVCSVFLAALLASVYFVCAFAQLRRMFWDYIVEFSEKDMKSASAHWIGQKMKDGTPKAQFWVAESARQCSPLASSTASSSSSCNRSLPSSPAPCSSATSSSPSFSSSSSSSSSSFPSSLSSESSSANPSTLICNSNSVSASTTAHSTTSHNSIFGTIAVDRCEPDDIPSWWTQLHLPLNARLSELHRVYVLPNHRGAGTAKRLVRVAEQWACERGCTHVFLITTSFQHAAVHMYESLGYRIVRKPQLLKWWVPEWLLYLVKEL